MIKYGLLLLLLLWIDPNKIGKVNKAKTEAKNAFQRGEFKNAVAQYKTLVDSLGVKEDEVTMNLAHSYFQLNDTVNAKNSYSSLTTSPNAKIKSLANQQLGVLANREGKFEEALNYFRNALKTDPTNEEARYNYEMVKIDTFHHSQLLELLTAERSSPHCAAMASAYMSSQVFWVNHSSRVLRISNL